MFKKGDIVTWSSQAGGVMTEKTGKIIGVLQPKESPYISNYRWNECKFNPSAKRMFDGCPRDHESYIIQVETKTGKGKPRLYWPRVSGLTLKK